MERPDKVEQLKRAQERIEALQAGGVDMRSAEARRAVNTLITQIRHASPEELAQFNAWKQGRGRRDSP